MKTRSSKKDPQAQSPGLENTVTVKLLPPESVQRPPTPFQGALESSQSLGSKRGREIEEESPNKRRKDPQHVITSTQHFKCLTEKNLEGLDRHTRLNTSKGVEHAATIAGRVEEEQPSLWSGSSPDRSGNSTSHLAYLKYTWQISLGEPRRSKYIHRGCTSP